MQRNEESKFELKEIAHFSGSITFANLFALFESLESMARFRQ